MNEQGAPGPTRPDDTWWHTVYAGPAGTLPDTPDAATDTTSVDDWFTAAAGLFAPEAAAEPPQPAPATRSWAEAAWPTRDTTEDRPAPQPTEQRPPTRDQGQGPSEREPKVPAAPQAAGRPTAVEPDGRPGAPSGQGVSREKQAAWAPGPEREAAPAPESGVSWREPGASAAPQAGERSVAWVPGPEREAAPAPESGASWSESAAPQAGERSAEWAPGAEREAAPAPESGVSWREPGASAAPQAGERSAEWAPGAALRVWTPANARVKFVKQVAPTVEDLTDRRTEAGTR
ncbi:hypothetical protein ACWEMJ_15940, partial [Kitasatospora sp. NPDC004531]